MSEIKKLFDECFGELASDLPSKVFIRKLQDIILSGRPKKKEIKYPYKHNRNYNSEHDTAIRNEATNQTIDEYDNWIKTILK